MEKVKVVITGGEGFIGSNLIEALVRNGCEVHSVDNRAREQVRVQGCAYHLEDVRDLRALSQVFLRADVVFHMAAYAEDTANDPVGATEVNELGTLIVLEAARIAKVRRVVFSSTGEVYGDVGAFPCLEEMEPRPCSLAAVNKLAGEQHMKLYAKMHGVETVSLRYFNVYGPGFKFNNSNISVVGHFLRLKKSGRPLQVTGDGLQTRDFIHVWDVVAANIAAATSEDVGRGEVINIGTGLKVAINGVAALVGGLVENIPARPEVKHSLACIDRANKLLFWEPEVPIQAGIAMMKKEWGVE